MTKYHRISYEDWENEHQCMQQLSGAVFALLYKLEAEGLEDCTEFERGQTSIERFRQLTLNSIDRLNNEIDKLGD